MRLKAVRTPEGIRGRVDPVPVPIWSGLTQVSIKNVSSLVVRLVERSWAWEYNIALLDLTGKRAPLTDYGKSLTPGRETVEAPYIGPASVGELAPGEEQKRELYLSQIYKIEVGQAYIVRVQRDFGLPKTNQIGRPIKPSGLSCSLQVPVGPLAEVQ
jgi:hypothetical protein